MPTKKTGLGSMFSEAMTPKPQELNQEDTLPHVVIRARAGCGKSTTMLEGLRLMIEGKTSLLPNDQQSEIWEQILKSDQATSICMTAFNKEIAEELKKKVPQFYPPSKGSPVFVSTLHGLGNRAIYNSFGNSPLDADKSKKLLAKIRRVSYEELLAKSGNFAYEVSELVSKCKLHLFKTPTYTDLHWINENYNLDFDLQLSHELAVTAVFKESLTCTSMIDYDDMIWLPLVNDTIELPKWDLLFVDEGSDLDLSQQEFVMRIGRRIIFCGDPQQAIYSFRGSDSRSFERMASRLKTNRETIVLPLTVTYRCSQAVAKEAQKWVNDLVAYEGNPQGLVDWKGMVGYRELVQDGDMIICRNNAPLVSECLKFIKDGRKAYIRGRKDIAKGLVKLIHKVARASSDRESINRFKDQLDVWKNLETAKADAKKDDRLAAYIQDRYDCIQHFLSDPLVKCVSYLITKVEHLFNDKEQKGICLGTIHQVKGLEADRVFFLMPKGAECPAYWAKTEDQKEQDKNLRYIGITRSRHTLYYVD